jgi:hypothetical protein
MAGEAVGASTTTATTAAAKATAKTPSIPVRLDMSALAGPHDRPPAPSFAARRHTY